MSGAPRREPDALDRLLALPMGPAPAVEWQGTVLDRDGLEEAVSHLAARLTDLGARGANLLVFGPLCPAYVVALLACLRCGAVPVPVDAGMSVQQYSWLARTARPLAVLSSDVSASAHYRGGTAPELVLDATTGRVVLDVPGGPESASRQGLVAARYADTDAGYLIPTSGSTGTPKAVVGSRTGLARFLEWFTTEFDLTESDSCAAVTRVNFDPSLRELLAPLAVGGRLCLPGPHAQLDFRALARHLVQSQASTAFLVPSLGRRIGQVLRDDGLRLEKLRLVFFAGEVLPAQVVEQWAALAPGAELVNLYGMTEGTLAQFFRRGIRPPAEGQLCGLPVGHPRPGVAVAIEDPDPDGFGAVLISSAAPARGLLEERSDDWSRGLDIRPLPAQLRTGDLGCLDERGELVIAGRLGDDLKVNGRRVDFHAFVEAVERLPEVVQCVVIDRQGPNAFIALSDDAPEAAEARAALRDRVRALAAGLGVPRPEVHLRGPLPLLRSGKVDRLALATSLRASPAPHGGAPVHSRTRSGASRAAEDANTVSLLIDLLRLGADASASTSLVDAGISSLDLMELVLELERLFAVTLSVQECFALRDVGTLARTLDRARRRDTGLAQPATATPAEPGPDRTEWPLSTRQLAYQAACMAEGNANWCNLSREVAVDRVLSEQEVTAAVGHLLARHDALRLSLSADGTRQLHHEPQSLPIPVAMAPAAVDSAVLPDTHRAQVQAARAETVSRLIDVAAAPPIRVVAVPGPGTTSVLLIAHHLFVDGLSMDLLAEELRALLRGQALDPPRPDVDFRAYSLRTAREGPATTQALESAAYWRELLKGAEHFELPQARGPEADGGWLLSRPFGVVRSRIAHRLAEQAGVSVFAVVLAAFEAAVVRCYGISPVSLVIPAQLREGVPGDVVGMFTSQLVVRGQSVARLGRDARSLQDRATELSQQLALGAAASDWEFDQRLTDFEPAGDRFPISTVLFNQHARPRGLHQRDLGSWVPRALGRSLRYQLQGELQVSGTELALTYYYRRGIAPDGDDVIDRFHARLLTELAAAASATEGGTDDD